MFGVAAQTENDVEKEFNDEYESAPVDTLTPLTGNWVQQLWQTGFHINDSRINYPKFAKFCVKVYNWGDATFNRFDSDYVTGTGKNWKITLNAAAGIQGYGYLFDFMKDEGRANRVIVRSNFNYDMGVYLSFMAVSIGYTFNMNKLLNYNDHPRSSFNFAFNCARFSAELQMQTTEGNTYIERFGQYNDGRRIHVQFNDISTKLLSVRAYYYFNHRKYANAAVYAFSKYQKKSAGTWMLGGGYSHQQMTLDFSELPNDMLRVIPKNLPLLSQFDFHDFEILGGYGYNAVMPHNWVFNITLLPAIGYRRMDNAGERNLSEMFSLNGYGRMGLVYNHRAFFANFTVQSRLGFVFDSEYSFVNTQNSFAVTVGARF